MFKMFKSHLFNTQLTRTLGATTYQMAEIGECLATSANIKEQDKESWYQEWLKQADKNFHEAESFLKNKLTVNACYNFLRASNYYRTAYFFLEDNPSDNRIEKALKSSIKSFQNAITLLNIPIEVISIPYENIQIPAYLYLQPNQTKPLPIIINCSGGDGTKEESYFTASEALARGYICLTFEGPGQGSVLRLQKIPLTPLWENVTASVIDFLYTRPEVDTKNIIYLGKSFSGFLAARAITKEHRISACILDPGQFDLSSNIEKKFSSLLPNKPMPQVIEEVIKQADFDNAFMLKSRMWRYGVHTAEEFWKEIQKYTLEGLVENITCPVMIFDNEEEYLSLGQAQLLFNQIQSKKDYYLFTAHDFSGGHCEPLIPRVFYGKMFAWLQQNIIN